MYYIIYILYYIYIILYIYLGIYYTYCLVYVLCVPSTSGLVPFAGVQVTFPAR